MRYQGKVLGFILGLLSGTGFLGLTIGLSIGHIIDKLFAMGGQGYFVRQQTRQMLFFRTTFQIMGHLSKSKGRVTHADIQMASLLMDRMQLHGDARQAAQRAFREGKQHDYPLRNKLHELRSVCFGRFNLIRMFLEIQLQSAFSDGSLHPKEQQVLYIIAEELGISHRQFYQLLHTMQSNQNFSSDRQPWRDTSQQYYQPMQREPSLEDAYSVLGVKSHDDSTTVKRAYRKLMSEYHPDKLIAKGLPPEMLVIAKQKAQKIQSAYELIKRGKKFK